MYMLYAAMEVYKGLWECRREFNPWWFRKAPKQLNQPKEGGARAKY